MTMWHKAAHLLILQDAFCTSGWIQGMHCLCSAFSPILAHFLYSDMEKKALQFWHVRQADGRCVKLVAVYIRPSIRVMFEPREIRQ